jgi:hypothetical protein
VSLLPHSGAEIKVMKDPFTKIVLLLAFVTGLAGNAPAMDPDFARFVGEKSRQVREFSKTETNRLPSVVWNYFDALRVDDWQTATNLANRIEELGKMLGTNTITPALQGPVWQPISETIGAYDQFHELDIHWLHRFGSNIISSIPRGSVYFGGTDPGRYIVSAMSESQSEGVPFFTLTQNQLVDGRYMDYLRLIYGKKLSLPTDQDSQNAFTDYMQDAEVRKKSGKLKPGEEIRVLPDGHVQVSGVVSVMAINGLLVKRIFEKNPTREFYIEESFALDWMYPQLQPHGLIMRLNREPLRRLSEDVVKKDLDYWNHQTADALGNWLNEGASVADVCSFCEKVYLHKDLESFKGDRGYAKNDDTQKTFSKLRSSIAGLYAWHAEHDENADDKARMKKAADFAFRQAFALCPYSPEAVYRYTEFLTSVKRPDDALLIAETAARVRPDDSEIGNALNNLRKGK